VTDLDTLWLATMQQVARRAAHELKDALNGVHLNLEVIRSRSSRDGGGSGDQLFSFAESASNQLEWLTERIEALLFLSRGHRDASVPADVAVTLRHLAALLVPAVKSDGGVLTVEGASGEAPTAASAVAARLALAEGLLTLTKEGGKSRCRLERSGTPESGAGTVVRFSHESADTGSIAPAVASALAEHQIRTQRSGSDLLMVFPGT